MKQLLTFLAITGTFLTVRSQNLIKNFPVSGMLDSSFVVQTGTIDSFHSGNHPGAGPYSSANILICSGATLKYDYMMGTSNLVSFYLEENATLQFYQEAFAEIYSKNSSVIDAKGNTLYAYKWRTAGSNYINMGTNSNTIHDSVFSQIQFQFTGWPGNVSPCAIPSHLEESETPHWMLKNPVHSYLEIPWTGSTRTQLFDLSGRLVFSATTRQQNVDVQAIPSGLYIVKLIQENKQHQQLISIQ